MGKYFSSMPESLLHKYIRKNCAVRLTNGKKEKLSGDALLNEGDVLAFYISDEFFPENRGKAGPGQPEIGRDAFRTLEPRLSVAYEDENILIADKPSGLVVHDSADESYNTLINHILAYLYRKGEYRPDEENVFSPALCNRIDRNTEGLVIAAKNARALAEM
ncbi:MAG: RluA family pseudouridine synthase, partial [Clostridia bacterium]|nr:RluA family pseudouridine synthase [Clostridia bacterium]